VVNLVHYLLFAASFLLWWITIFKNDKINKNKTVNIYNSKSVVFSTWLYNYSDNVMVRSQNECCDQYCNYALYNNAYVNVAAEHQRKNSRMTHYTWWCLPEPAARCEFQLSLYCPTCYYSATGRGAEYCDECVCLSVCVCVCLSIRDHIFGSARPIFTKYFVHVTYGRDSVLLWRRIDALCTSGFMDNVIFAHKPQT